MGRGSSLISLSKLNPIGKIKCIKTMGKRKIKNGRIYKVYKESETSFLIEDESHSFTWWAKELFLKGEFENV